MFESFNRKLAQLHTTTMRLCFLGSLPKSCPGQVYFEKRNPKFVMLGLLTRKSPFGISKGVPSNTSGIFFSGRPSCHTTQVATERAVNVIVFILLLGLLCIRIAGTRIDHELLSRKVIALFYCPSIHLTGLNTPRYANVDLSDHNSLDFVRSSQQIECSF